MAKKYLFIHDLEILYNTYSQWHKFCSIAFNILNPINNIDLKWYKNWKISVFYTSIDTIDYENIFMLLS